MKHLYILLSFFYLSTSLAQADIIMGVVPQQSPLKLLKVWKPITEYLSQSTGEKVIFKTEKSINKFEKVLYKGGYDFAYMSPSVYVISHKLKGYTAEVRADKDIRGILVMKKDADINILKDKNARFLFPSPNAFAATLLTKYDLINAYQVTPEVLDKGLYVNSHDSVYKGVSRGIGDIGGGIERTFNNLNDTAVKENLKIVHRTKAYPSHPFAFKPSMDKKTKERVIKALLNMPPSLLKALSIKRLKPIDNDEYSDVKALAIKLKLMPK